MADAETLRLDDVTVHGDDGSVIEGFSLRLASGEAVSLRGPDDHARGGLLRAAAGLRRPSAGAVSLLGVDVAEASEHQALDLRARTGVVFAKHGLLSNLSLVANVGLPIRVHERASSAESFRVAHARLERAGLADYAERFPATLPLGKARLGALVRALVLDPEVLFFEEAALGFDEHDLARVHAILESERRERRLAVLATSSLASPLFDGMDRLIPISGGS